MESIAELLKQMAKICPVRCKVTITMNNGELDFVRLEWVFKDGKKNPRYYIYTLDQKEISTINSLDEILGIAIESIRRSIKND